MAATVSAWNKPGAWALDSEENEDELLHQHNQDSLKKSNNITAPAVVIPEADFPSLGAVVKTKAARKKKPQTLSLQEFSTYSKGLTQDELIVLPTAPRERTEEELNQSRIGGGFRSYDNNNRSSRISDDSRRSNREFTPSRADETDNWGAAKKSTPIGGGFDRRGERGERGGSRADEVDNWASKKSFVPSDGRRSERRLGGFESNGGRADSEDWMKKKEHEGERFGGSFDRSRRGSNESMNSSDLETWGRKKEEFNGNGVAVRPRLNLQPRTKPLVDGQQKGNEGNDDVVVKAKGSNPFGEARPREEVLKEKGQDWKEIDEKLEAAKIKEVRNSPDGRRGFGIGNGRGRSSERAWRKPYIVDPRPSSSEKSENGLVEATQDGETQA